MWDLDTAGYPSDNAIPYIINPTRPPGVEILPVGTTEAELVAAIRNVFVAFENIQTSKLRFKFLGVDHNAQFSVDGIMLVTLDFNDPGVSCGGSNFKTATLAPVTGSYTLPGSGEQIWIERIFSYIDYDIALCDIPLSLDARSGTTDLASLLTHEIGHMLGLGHSILKPTSMSGYSTNMRETQRTLSSDDEIGLSVIYPEPTFFADTGRLEGVVSEVDSMGMPIGEVFGAHITVIDAATGVAVAEAPTGVTAVDGTTGRAVAWDAGGLSGRFVISGLPPGDYLIRVDAYDGPATVSSGKIINLDFWDADSLGPRRDFGYLRDPTPYTVSAGAVTDVGTLEVGPFDPDFPNVDSGIISRPDGIYMEPAIVRTGLTTSAVALPKGANASPTDSIYVDGTNGVQLLNPRWSGSGLFILVDAQVSANAPVGPHSIVVENNHGFSLIHGGLMIAPGIPSVDSISPACPYPLTSVQVFGQNFSPDTHILFDGYLASDIVVQSPTMITATTPANISWPTTVSFVSDIGTDDEALVTTCTPTAVPNSAPTRVEVGLSHPNPFSGSTRIPLQLQGASRVEVSIYDVLGRRVRTLTAASLPPGRQAMTWDGTSDRGTPVASGRYFARVRIGVQEVTRSIVLIR